MTILQYQTLVASPALSTDESRTNRIPISIKQELFPSVSPPVIPAAFHVEICHQNTGLTRLSSALTISTDMKVGASTDKDTQISTVEAQ